MPKEPKKAKQAKRAKATTSEEAEEVAEATQAMPQRPAPKEKAKSRAAPQDESSGLAPVDPAVTLILSASPFDLGPPTPSADSSQTSDMDTHSGANLKRAAEELLDQQEARPFPPVPAAGLVQSKLDSWAPGAKKPALRPMTVYSPPASPESPGMEVSGGEESEGEVPSSDPSQ